MNALHRIIRRRAHSSAVFTQPARPGGRHLRPSFTASSSSTPSPPPTTTWTSFATGPRPPPPLRPITGTVRTPPPHLTADSTQPSATVVAHDLQDAGAEAKTMFSRSCCCYYYFTGSTLFFFRTHYDRCVPLLSIYMCVCVFDHPPK